MPRYIDADKLIAHLKDEIKACEPVFGGRANGKSVAYGTELGLKSAISYAETLSTADVVPKSEVERVYYNLQAVLEERAETKQEIAREIFEEIYEDCFDQFGYIDYEALAELKKKYTEEKKNDNQN